MEVRKEKKNSKRNIEGRGVYSGRGPPRMTA